jgi:hypothetical protein
MFIFQNQTQTVLNSIPHHIPKMSRLLNVHNILALFSILFIGQICSQKISKCCPLGQLLSEGGCVSAGEGIDLTKIRVEGSLFPFKSNRERFFLTLQRQQLLRRMSRTLVRMEFLPMSWNITWLGTIVWMGRGMWSIGRRSIRGKNRHRI